MARRPEERSIKNVENQIKARTASRSSSRSSSSSKGNEKKTDAVPAVPGQGRQQEEQGDEARSVTQYRKKIDD